MKILLDARFYGLEHAGLGRYTMNLVEELAQLDKKNDYVILLRQKYFDELKLPKNWKKVKVNAKHYTIREQANLPLTIRKYKPDLVHFLHSNIPIFYRGKFIVTIHDMTMYNQGIDATTLPLPLYLAKRIPFKMVYRKAVYESQTIITPSQAVKDELIERFKISEKKVVVTYEGIQENQESRIKNHAKTLETYKLKDKKIFLYVGNLYPHKNVRRAIEAITLLNQELRIKNKGKRQIADQARNDDTVYFVIVSGRGAFRHRVERQIEKLEAKEYVKILNFVSDEELTILYRNSLAFVFPSLSEGFGLPGLEALQSGTLLLASDIPVFKEIYKDRAIYFDPKDSNSIVKSMKRIVQLNTIEKESKIKESQKFIKNYSWNKMAKETLKVYSN
jgi:glycosyltransferase involved in cell wall biosynthesis